MTVLSARLLLTRTLVGSLTLAAVACGRTPIVDTAHPGGTGDTSSGHGAAEILSLALAGPTAVQVNLCMPFTVSLHDSAGQPHPAASTLNVALQTTGAGLYADAVCALRSNHAKILEGNSTQTFFLLAISAGTITLDATAPGVTPASLSLPAAISAAGPPTGLVLSGPALVVPNRCSAVALALVDANGYAVLTPAALMVDLAADGPGVVFDDSACATAVTAATLGSGTSGRALFFRVQAAATTTLTASATGLLSGRLSITAAAAVGTPAQLEFVCPTVVSLAACAVCAVSVMDDASMPVLLAADAVLGLTATGGRFYADAICSSAVTTTTVVAGAGSTAVYYQARAAGTFVLSVMSATLGAAGLLISVFPASYPPGVNCVANGDCPSGHCECGDLGCASRRCSPVDCDCQDNVEGDGVCDDFLLAGTNDPDESCGPVERCNGTGGCRASIVFAAPTTLSMPAVTAGWSSSALFVNGPDANSLLTIGDWNNAYASYGVRVYPVDASGTTALDFTFQAPANQPIGQGKADEPAFVACSTANHLYYMAVDPVSDSTRNIDITLPSGITGNASNMGSVHKRGVYLFFYRYDQGKVMRADVSTASAVTAGVVLDTASAGLPGTLHDICVGDSQVYGVLATNQLAVWDLDFNFIEYIPFAPSPTLGFGHFGGAETECFVEHDGMVYLLSAGALHLIAAGKYYHVGSHAGLAWYEYFGGWGVRDGTLRVYRTSDNTLSTYEITFR